MKIIKTQSSEIKTFVITSNNKDIGFVLTDYKNMQVMRNQKRITYNCRYDLFGVFTPHGVYFHDETPLKHLCSEHLTWSEYKINPSFVPHTWAETNLERMESAHGFDPYMYSFFVTLCVSNDVFVRYPEMLAQSPACIMNYVAKNNLLWFSDLTLYRDIMTFLYGE